MIDVRDKLGCYVVADIHGEYDRLIYLLGEIQDHMETHSIANAELVFVGDYIDRGPDSFKVLETVFNMVHNPGNFVKVTALMGNHEDMMTSPDYQMRNCWLMNGGIEAIESFIRDKEGFLGEPSYMISPRRALGNELFEWVLNLPIYYEVGDVCVAHAGVDFADVRAEDHSRESLLWSRTLRMSNHNIYKLTVHGHTPHNNPLMGQGVAYIDTGAVFSELQPLIALYIPDVNNPTMESLEIVTHDGSKLEQHKSW